MSRIYQENELCQEENKMYSRAVKEENGNKEFGLWWENDIDAAVDMLCMYSGLDDLTEEESEEAIRLYEYIHNL